jgi:hypothetical protein
MQKPFNGKVLKGFSDSCITRRISLHQFFIGRKGFAGDIFSADYIPQDFDSNGIGTTMPAPCFRVPPTECRYGDGIPAPPAKQDPGHPGESHKQTSPNRKQGAVSTETGIESRNCPPQQSFRDRRLNQNTAFFPKSPGNPGKTQFNQL